MKVVNIMTSNLNYNGIGMSLLNYYDNISSDNIQMDYIVPNKVDNNLKKEFTKKGNKIYELEYKGGKMHQKNPVLYFVTLYKIFKSEHYDIVHAHGSSSMLFLQLLSSMMAGVKVRIAHSRNTKSNYGIINLLAKPLFYISYNVAFSCGKEAGKWLFGNRDFTIIPNGKNCDKFKFNQLERIEIRNRFGLNNKKVLGHVGNFNYQKNHEFLIKLFKKLKENDDNYVLVLAGDGETRDFIEEKVREYKLTNSVIFLGQIPVSEISKWLNAMDIMVFPSRFEGFPNVLIEWQMNGLPCIISNKITKDVCITKLVRFANIDSISDWVQSINNVEIVDRKNNNAEILNNIKNAGYDIKENAILLEKEYERLYEKYCK